MGAKYFGKCTRGQAQQQHLFRSRRIPPLPLRRSQTVRACGWNTSLHRRAKPPHDGPRDLSPDCNESSAQSLIPLREHTDTYGEVYMQVVFCFMASLKRFCLDILDSLESYQG
ncbi:MAG TPA: hypothetical protein VGF26_27315 [Ramlibacter sp.]